MSKVEVITVEELFKRIDGLHENLAKGILRNAGVWGEHHPKEYFDQQVFNNFKNKEKTNVFYTEERANYIKELLIDKQLDAYRLKCLMETYFLPFGEITDESLIRSVNIASSNTVAYVSLESLLTKALDPKVFPNGRDYPNSGFLIKNLSFNGKNEYLNLRSFYLINEFLREENKEYSTLSEFEEYFIKEKFFEFFIENYSFNIYDHTKKVREIFNSKSLGYLGEGVTKEIKSSVYNFTRETWFKLLKKETSSSSGIKTSTAKSFIQSLGNSNGVRSKEELENDFIHILSCVTKNEKDLSEKSFSNRFSLALEHAPNYIKIRGKEHFYSAIANSLRKHQDSLSLAEVTLFYLALNNPTFWVRSSGNQMHLEILEKYLQTDDALDFIKFVGSVIFSYNETLPTAADYLKSELKNTLTLSPSISIPLILNKATIEKRYVTSNLSQARSAYK